MNVMNDEPLVSFVVITHNRAADLMRCLDSIRAQRYPRRETVVVDNQSTDDTLALVRQRFPEARLIPLQQNLGVSGGRNQGTLAADGSICVYLDDDAWLEDPEATATIVRYFERPALAALALTIVDAESGVEETKGIPRRDKKSLTEDYQCTYFCGAGFAMRRDRYIAAGMFWDPLVYGSQEMDLAYRLIDSGQEIWHAANVRVRHRSAPSSRPSGQWVYFNARDRPWVAMGHLPWPQVVTTTALWWANTFFKSLRSGEVGAWARGVGASIAGFRRALARRRVIRPEARALLRARSGRLWY